MKTGLRNFINKYTFLFYILITLDLSAQVHINGFCRYRSFDSAPGYKSLLSLNYNNDAYSDLFLFSPQLKAGFAVTGDPQGNLSEGEKVSFRYTINSIKNLSFGNHYSSYYVFVSRKARTAGLLNFRQNGQMNLLHELKFDSYPEKIDVSDIQSDEAPDVLVSGSSFNGISILKVINGKISETKIVKDTPYKDAVFADCTNDGLDDIAAVNLYTASIDFFNNDSKGRFRFARSLKLNELPVAIISRDMDLDFYEDIIWSDSKGISVIYGDAVSQYNEKVTISTLHTPHELISGDYNSDGLMDLIYADTINGIISVLFSSEQREFSAELILLKKNNISSVVPFYSKFINGIAALGNDGKIYVVDKISSFTEDLSITAGVKPGVIKSFDNRNDGIPDICYIDEERSSVNFLTRDAAGIPDLFFSYSLHQPHKQIIIDDLSKSRKTFYCWTEGDKLIEVIDADFNKGEFSKTSLYATGKIDDMKIQPVKDGPAVIYAAYIKNGVAGANVFEFHDFRYRRTDYSGFAIDVENIAVYTTSKETGFFTWQKRNSLSLYKHSLKNIQGQEIIGKIPEGNIAFSIAADFFNNDTPSQIASARSGTLITAGRKFNILQVPDSTIYENKDNFWIGSAKPNGLKQLFYYNPESKSLNLITLFNRRKNLILSELISGINVKRFFIRSMTRQVNHIVYTDPVENCIRIKRIK